jgi:hypothetical protein
LFLYRLYLEGQFLEKITGLLGWTLMLVMKVHMPMHMYHFYHLHYCVDTWHIFRYSSMSCTLLVFTRYIFQCLPISHLFQISILLGKHRIIRSFYTVIRRPKTFLFLLPLPDGYPRQCHVPCC